MLTYFLFILGFILLIKGADFLVNGASAIAKKFKISEIVIGLTIVSIGTSAPELFINIISSIQGEGAIALGNILGSNIANVFLILGLTTIVYPLVVRPTTAWKEIPFSLSAALILWLLTSDTGLSRLDGAVLLICFFVFMYYVWTISSKSTSVEMDEQTSSSHSKITIKQSSVMIFGGLLGLILGGHWIVKGAITIAESFDISKSVIALTIVALGTSLPELTTSLVAAYKKKSDIAIGNIIGSNILNIFLILGISSLINPIPFSLNFHFDMFFAVFASLVLFVFVLVGKKFALQRYQGVILFLIYISYITYLILG